MSRIRQALVVSLAGWMWFSWPALLSARTIHVAPPGSDAAQGVVSAPFKTIGKALSIAGPGDTVMIAAGVYREGPLVPRRGATKQHRLTLCGPTNGTAVIKGSTEVTGWRDSGGGRWTKDGWTVNSQQLFVDGAPLQQIGVQSPWHAKSLWDGRMCLPPVGKGAQDLTPGSFYYDAGAESLTCILPDRGDPNVHLMEASVRDFLLDGNGRSFVTVRNLRFEHSNGTSKGAWAALLRTSGVGWLIEDCTFAHGDFAGVGLSGDGHVMRRCRLINNGDVGLNVNGSDAAHGYHRYKDRPPQNILLEDLTVTNNNTRRFYEHWHAGGMKLIPVIRAVVVRRCLVADNWGPGIWFDGALGDNVVEDNVVRDNRTGIFYEISMPAEGDRLGMLIQNNRVFRNHSQGIYVSASRGAVVRGNTCYQNGWDIVVHGMPRSAFGQDLKLVDNVVEDNIVCGRLADIIVYVGEGSGTNIVDGNFYAVPGADEAGAHSGGVAFGAVKGTGYDAALRTLEAVRKAGFETHGSTGDPLWLDAGGGDFSTRENSPVAGKGWQRSH